MKRKMLFEIKETLDRLAMPLYVARGRKPWSAGYYSAKKDCIGNGIDLGVMGTADLPPGYGLALDERVVEYPWLFAQLPKRPGRVLDAGSALNHRFLLDRAPLSDAELTIMTLAPEKRCYWSRSISYVYGDLRRTMFESGSFDVIASISTIEHIGLDNTLHYTADASKKESDASGFVPAILEFRRLLKPGGLCLITVPFGRQGVHGWYQVFDLAMVHRVIDSFGPVQHATEYFGYSAAGWRRTTAADIARAEFFDVHAGHSANPDLAAGARGVACIRMVA